MVYKYKVLRKWIKTVDKEVYFCWNKNVSKGYFCCVEAPWGNPTLWPQRQPFKGLNHISIHDPIDTDLCLCVWLPQGQWPGRLGMTFGVTSVFQVWPFVSTLVASFCSTVTVLDPAGAWGEWGEAARTEAVFFAFPHEGPCVWVLKGFLSCTYESEVRGCLPPTFDFSACKITESSQSPGLSHWG